MGAVSGEQMGKNVFYSVQPPLEFKSRMIKLYTLGLLPLLRSSLGIQPQREGFRIKISEMLKKG